MSNKWPLKLLDHSRAVTANPWKVGDLTVWSNGQVAVGIPWSDIEALPATGVVLDTFSKILAADMPRPRTYRLAKVRQWADTGNSRRLATLDGVLFDRRLMARMLRGAPGKLLQVSTGASESAPLVMVCEHRWCGLLMPLRPLGNVDTGPRLEDIAEPEVS